MELNRIGFIISEPLDIICLGSLIEFYKSRRKVSIFVQPSKSDEQYLKNLLTLASKFDVEVIPLNINETLKKTDIFFTSNPDLDSSLYSFINNIGSRFVYIPYGNSISDEAYSYAAQYNRPVHKLACKIYTISEYHKNMYQKYTRSIFGNFINIKTTPKFDHVLKCINNNAINNKKFTFLWNIHYSILPSKTANRSWSAFLYYYQKIYEILKNNKEIAIIARLHPYLLNAFPETITCALNILKDCDNFSIEMGSSIDYSQAFSYADAYITDLSSMFFDFLITKKPIISLHYPFSCKLNNFASGMYNNFSYKANSVDDLDKHITQLADGDDRLFQYRSHILDSGKLFDLSRPACEIIADDINNLSL